MTSIIAWLFEALGSKMSVSLCRKLVVMAGCFKTDRQAEATQIDVDQTNITRSDF